MKNIIIAVDDEKLTKIWQRRKPIKTQELVDIVEQMVSEGGLEEVMTVHKERSTGKEETSHNSAGDRDGNHAK